MHPARPATDASKEIFSGVSGLVLAVNTREAAKRLSSPTEVPA